MLSDKNYQAEASVEPIESTGVEVVAPIPIPEYVNELVTRAKGAAGRLATLSTAVKNRALLAMAEALEEQKDALLCRQRTGSGGLRERAGEEGDGGSAASDDREDRRDGGRPAGGGCTP